MVLVAMMAMVVPCGHLRAQSAETPQLPQHVCAGASVMVDMTESVQTTLGQSERIFLPDGVPCGSLGCSYVSSVTFDAFQPGATVTSVDDINYLRLNIEHSWIGDILINLECPNGQHASLLNWSSTGHSQCTDQVPASNIGWQTDAPNMSKGTFLGQAYDYQASPACDSTLPFNAPGVGWNYCWSNSTTAGITYAPGPGSLIYRAEHRHDGKVDSSDVAARSNFYHPDQSFTSLVGCPLNGTWSIEVMDAWNIDNGYVFSWDLSLNAERVSDTDTCEIVTMYLTGPYISPVGNTLYRLEFPDSLGADTTVSYQFGWTNSCGDTFDTVMYVTIHMPVGGTEQLHGCPMATWNGVGYVFDTTFVSRLTTVYGCDSLVTVNITTGQKSYVDIYDTICRGATYVFYGDTCSTYYTRLYTHTFPDSNAMGCDSVVRLHLNVANITMYVNDTVDGSQLPYTYRGYVFMGEGSQTFISSSEEGCDTVVNYHLHVVNRVYLNYDTLVCQNQMPLKWRGVDFAEADTVVQVFPAADGNDTVVTLALAYLPSYIDTVQGVACLPSGYRFGDSVYYAAGTYTMPFFSQFGCDSTVTLELAVGEMAYVDLVDTFCFDRYYEWHGQTVGGENTEERRFQLSDTVHVPGQCDSVLTLRLVQLARPQLVLTDSVDCQWLEHHLSVATDMPYRHWWSSDGTFVAEDGSLSAVVTPAYAAVVYHVAVDRREEVYCPLEASLALSPVRIPEAAIKLQPEVLTREALGFQAYDVTHDEVMERTWYLDGEMQYSHSNPLEAYADSQSDSVTVTLEVYNGYCRDTAEGVLHVIRVNMFAPNVFAPGQGTDNRFTVETKGVEMLELCIYNRNGLLVYRTDRPAEGWDGRDLDGRPCQQAAYVWLLRYRAADYPEVTRTATGSVTLLR